MEYLQEFTLNGQMRDEVKDYLTAYVKQQIIAQALSGNDVKALAECKVIIDKAFNTLIAEYTRPTESEHVNEME